MTTCELNQIFLGEVATIQNYGAFVRIPGCKQQGLIHKSQVSSVRVDDVGDVLQRGDQVWCKVVNIDDDGKIGLSMKLVNQGNGRDLDPNGVEWQRNEQRKKSMGDKPGKRAIELQAVLNTTCSQCGTKGHLASDCFGTADGKKYELIPEIEDDIVVPAVNETVESSDKLESKVKTKKLKRKKKSKKSKHHYSDDSSSDDSSSQEKKRKKKKKKHSKEAKKRKRKQSDSESDSSDKNKHSKKCKHSRSKYSD